MAVYIELVPIDNRPKSGGSGAGRRKAGKKNVRRPFRGIEVKDSTHAFFRVVRADGSPLDLIDSSSKGGKGPDYANFILQSVQEARMERQQIIETFGAPYVFFFGESPRFIDVMATLIDTEDFNWHAEWWENYAKYFRGTRLAEMGCTALLHYDDTIVEGYPVSASSARQAGDQNVVQLQFRMFVTNYINVSNIGDPKFPVRNGAVLPDAYDPNKRSFTFDTGEPMANANRTILDAYLKRTAIENIRTQILQARTIERARALQKQYALEQLGVETAGANLLSVGKSVLQGVMAAITTDAESSQEAQQNINKEFRTTTQAMEKIREDSKKALELAQSGNPKAAWDLLRKGKVGAALDKFFPSQAPRAISLPEALRNALMYASPAPGNDLTGFLERVKSVVTPSGTKQIFDMKHIGPVRSEIWDNYDEYTERGEGEAALNAFEARTGIIVGGETPSLGRAISSAISDAGGVPTPRTMLGFSLLANPFSNPLVSINYGEDVNGISRAPFGADRYTYSRRWGNTPDAGGSYGGSLGGVPGIGYGGQASQPSDFFQVGSGLPQGSPYGQSGLPPSFYTDGLGPEGKPLYQKSYTYGPQPGATVLGGGPQIQANQNKGQGLQGQGGFAVLTVEGSLL